MKFHSLLLTTAVSLLAFPFAAAAALPLRAAPAQRTAGPPAAAATVRIDPTYWWVGMKNPRLQLLVHAPGIGNTMAILTAYPGVRLDGQQKLENPNYLVLNLVIDPATKPGLLKLGLKSGNTYRPYSYELRARNTDPNRTQGLTPADFIYMLMPDRFANGDPKNDVVKGTRVTTWPATRCMPATAATSKALPTTLTTLSSWASRPSGLRRSLKTTCPRPATTATR